MREIKFRAWDLDYKWMEPCVYLGEGVVFSEPSRYYDTPNVEIEENPNLIVMQFTGLKGKNGVEIYEGDIVNHYGVGIGFVEYRERQAAFNIVFSGTTRKWFVDMLDREYGLLEVIGNIYESPELLGVE